MDSTYKFLVLELCDKFLIACDPEILTVRVKVDSDLFPYVEIIIVSVGFHINIHDKYDKITRTNFCRNVVDVTEVLYRLEESF